MDDREKAMAWWNSLRSTRLMIGSKDKGYYTDKHFGFGRRMYQHLDSSEIHLIWEKEIGLVKEIKK